MPTEKLSATQAANVNKRWSKVRTMRGEIGFRPTDIRFDFSRGGVIERNIRFRVASYQVRLVRVDTPSPIAYPAKTGIKLWGKPAHKLILHSNAPAGRYVLETRVWGRREHNDEVIGPNQGMNTSWAANLAHSY